MSSNTTATTDFIIQFWGVRDGISTPGKDTVRYGGNTPCVEICLGTKRLIFDGGSGLRVLGNHLLRQMPVEAHIFFSNCHWDRLQGFPFFVPAFIPINHFHLYGAPTAEGESMQQRLSNQMLPPNFPVPIQVMGAKLEFYQITPDNQLFLDEIVIKTHYLNYDQRSLGYRITWQGCSVAYATASDEYAGHEDFQALVKDADLLILAAPRPAMQETSFTALKPLWLERVNLAKALGVKALVLSNYDPEYDDDLLDSLALAVKNEFANSSLAQEGMVIPMIGL
jgi:phosphoribosyl 1,2-cyclic phosphodiesterase